MFDVEALISQYGLLAIYGTAAVEGDIAVIAAGVMQQRGYFEFWPTIIAAMAGGWTSDLLIYGLARRFRNHPRTVSTVAAARKWRFFNFCVSRPMLLALAIRFMPGVRTIGPVSLAVATPLTPLRYVCLTGIAAFVWALTLVMVGRGAGHLLERLLTTLRLHENTGITVLIVLVLGLTGVTLWKLLRKRKRTVEGGEQ